VRLCADLEITRRCDLGCAVCFVQAQPDADAELTTEEVFAVLEQLPPERTLVHLTGGEPFVHPGIWAILERVAERGFRDVAINTHGGLIDADALGRLRALPSRVRLLVSLDGPEGVHDRARGVGATSAALAAIRGALERGMSARPASMLTAELVDGGIGVWHDWLDRSIGAGTSPVLYPLCVDPDRPIPPTAVGSPVQPERLGEVADQLADLHRGGRRIAAMDMPLINPLLRRRGVPDEALHPCDAGRGRFCIQADGWVSPCHPCRHPLIPTGPNLLRRLFTHADYRRIGRRTFEECGSCEERSVCGHCRAQVTGRGADLWGTDGWCARVRAAGELAPQGATEPPG